MCHAFWNSISMYKGKARLLPKGFEGHFWGHFTNLITGYFISRYSWKGGGGHGHKCRALNALNIYKWCRPQSPKVLLPFSSSSAQTRSLVPASEKLSGQLTLLLYLPTRSIYRYWDGARVGRSEWAKIFCLGMIFLDEVKSLLKHNHPNHALSEFEKKESPKCFSLL